MNNKLFKVVGITVHNGNTKVRFTDDMVRRVKQFSKGGATRVDFIELPFPMTKIDALNHMLTAQQFQSPNDQATITNTLEDKVKESRKGEVKVKAKPSLEAIKARPRKTTKETSVKDVLDAVKN